MQKNNKLAFTLLELIVVITILAILGTIAFIAMEGYSKSARDSTRLSNMSRIKTSLELFSLQTSKYPESTNPIQVTYVTDNLNLWNQGSFGMQTFRNIEKLDRIPLDPLTDKQYIYSVTSTGKEYQLGGMLETDDFVGIPPNPFIKGGVTPQVNALEQESKFRVIGNYNGKMLKVPNGTKTTILAVPSIITLCGTNVEEIVNNNYFLHDGYNRFPREFNGVGTYTQCDGTGEILVNSGSLVIFDGNTNSLVGEENTQARIDLISNIQSAYTGTYLASNNDSLSSILSIDIESNPEQADLLGQGIVSGNINTSIISSGGDSSLDNNTSISDNTITINAGFEILDIPNVGQRELYTKTIDGKKYALLRNTATTMLLADKIDPTGSGTYISDDVWLYFRDNGDNIRFDYSDDSFIFGVDGNLKYMRENTGVCVDLPNSLSQTNLYWQEDSGCSGVGQDYTIIPEGDNLHLYTHSSLGHNIAIISTEPNSQIATFTNNIIRGVRVEIPSGVTMVVNPNYSNVVDSDNSSTWYVSSLNNTIKMHSWPWPSRGTSFQTEQGGYTPLFSGTGSTSVQSRDTIGTIDFNREYFYETDNGKFRVKAENYLRGTNIIGEWGNITSFGDVSEVKDFSRARSGVTRLTTLKMYKDGYDKLCFYFSENSIAYNGCISLN